MSEHVEGGAVQLYRNVWAYGWVEGVGSLQESISFSLFECGKKKRKGAKLDTGDRVVPPGPWAEFWYWTTALLLFSDSSRPHGLQHTRLPCRSPSPAVYSNSCPSSQWCYLTIPSSATLFSSCPHSFSVSGSFPMCQLFISILKAGCYDQYQGNISCKDGLNKGQKWYGSNRSKRY